MSASYPPLPPELVAFAHGGVSILVGTCSRDGVPDCVRGMGVRIWPDACHLTLIMPAKTGAQSIANLATNPRLAVTLSHIPSHKTVQVKGNVLAIRDGNADDRALAEKYRVLLAEDLAFVGQPAANTLRLGIWPCHAIDLAIELVFAQTPGPSAGVKLPMSAEKSL
ncbi:MAG TPA: pyridoxamine 5'-phosphate oxidase family protein [Kofleriaceae bacterium]|nr:pyridoxamine 5'-phosphate oxidase family protein [Kofleriaceae bacterium]